jgi:hypothetical protein
MSLVVRLEVMTPNGKLEEIGCLVIHNDSSGDARTGNYNVKYAQDRDRSWRVEGFQRELGAWQLATLALESRLIPERIS